MLPLLIAIDSVVAQQSSLALQQGGQVQQLSSSEGKQLH